MRPGSGKTTLLQHVLLAYARNLQGKYRMRARIPFFLELRKVAPLLKSKTPPSLPKAIETIVKDNLRKLGKMPEGWLEARLRTGRCVLLWDGLDEVADLGQRRAVAKWLDEQTMNFDWHRNISLVSARPAGYRQAPLDRAHVLDVQPFDYDDTRNFIRKWYHANEIVSHGNQDSAAVRHRAESGASELVGRLHANPRLGDLTSNPLLLTMMCMVHRYQGALPGSRGQLYAEICQVLLERWRQARGIDDPHRGDQKLDVLRPLAAHMMIRELKEIPPEKR
jgi:predicted NACHT family NTPase